MPRLVTTAILAALTFAATATVAAQPAQVKEGKPGLLARAKVPPDSAQRIALAKVPGGTVADGIIDEVEGKLVYAFTIKTDAKPVDRVHVDAMTGAVLRVKREEPGDEMKEKKPPRL